MKLKDINNFQLITYIYDNNENVQKLFDLLDLETYGIDMLFKYTYNSRRFNFFTLNNFIINDEFVELENILYLFNNRYNYSLRKLCENLTLELNLLNDEYKTTINKTVNENIKNNIKNSGSDENIDSVIGFNSDDFTDSEKRVNNNNSNTDSNNDRTENITDSKIISNNVNALQKYKDMLSFYKDEYIYNIFFSYVANLLFNYTY